ncbi:iron-siderophore ABC transporter substrate-binding protein, partial [filamentous cyanobacterium CCP5]
ALGDESKAEEALSELEQDIATTRANFQSIVEDAPKALVLAANRLVGGNIFAITSQSYLGELMEELGFELVAPENGKNSAPLSLEALPELNEADHIFVLGYSMGDESAQQPDDPDQLLQQQTAGIEADWQENAIAQSLSATKANQVYFRTYLLWNGLNGPIGTRLVLQEIEQMLMQR